MRAYITKSKSGHYTLTVRDGSRRLFRESKLGSKEEARREYEKFKDITERVVVEQL